MTRAAMTDEQAVKVNAVMNNTIIIMHTVNKTINNEQTVNARRNNAARNHNVAIIDNEHTYSNLIIHE